MGEIFSLFKSFVGEQRPQLDIDKIATGETWFGQDAIERQLADSLQTFDDTLLELHTSGIEIYSVTYAKPPDSPLAKIVGASAAAGGHPAGLPGNWLTRGIAAAMGLPIHQHPQSQMMIPYAAPPELQPHQLRDPRYAAPSF